MKREIRITADGSHTIAIPQLQVTYHSTFGAIRESRHVFIEAGLSYVLQHRSAEDNSAFLPEQPSTVTEQPLTVTEKHSSLTDERPAATDRHDGATNATCIRIFEMGFGTGLNALLTYREVKESLPVYYYAAEQFPLPAEEAAALNYVQQLGDESLAFFFSSLHKAGWNREVRITPHFTLYKDSHSLPDIKTSQLFHLVYFDAFAPGVQPELWTANVFETMYNMLYNGGVLVTYCSKGVVRRTLEAAGFTVEKLKGPPGKREIIRAVKKA